MQVYTNRDSHWGTLDGSTVSRGLGMSGTVGIDYLWPTVAVSHMQAHTYMRTHSSRTLISLQLSPAAHSICLGFEETVFKRLCRSPQALNNHIAK